MTPATIDTNMVIFEVSASQGPAAAFCERLKQAGVLMLPFSTKRVRAVTHLDLDTRAIDRVCEIVGRVADGANR